MLATKSLLSNGGITQPCTRQGLISFFLVPDVLFHTIHSPHILAQSFYQPACVMTNVRNRQVPYCNLWLPNALQSHHLLLYPSPPGKVCDPCRLQIPPL